MTNRKILIGVFLTKLPDDMLLDLNSRLSYLKSNEI